MRIVQPPICLADVTHFRFAIYPFLKRFTHWPQAWLGIAMNFGIITAWMSSVDTINVPIIASTLAGCWWWVSGFERKINHLHSILVGRCSMVCFINVLRLIPCRSLPLPTDTIYACQDIKDDVKVGVRSTAILFGSWIRPLLVGCGLGFFAMLLTSGILNGQGVAYYIVSVGGAGCHLLWQYQTVDLTCPRSCWSASGHFSCM